MSGHNDDEHWFLRRSFRKLCVAFRDTIFCERYIMKDRLYRFASWQWRASKDEAREIFRMLPRAFPGVRYTNRGLFIPKEYLGLDGQAPARTGPPPEDGTPAANGRARSGMPMPAAVDQA